MTEQDDELIEVFIEESKEHLDGIEGDLLTMEERGADVDEELVNKVFRAMHSIKGAAGFFGLDNTKQLAHSAENVLGKIRKGDLIPTKEIVAVLLRAVDVLNEMMEAPDRIGEVDIGEPVAALAAILDAPPSGDAGKEAAAAPAPAAADTKATPAAIAPEEQPAAPSAPSVPDGPFISIAGPDGSPVFAVPATALQQATQAPKGGDNLFLVRLHTEADLRAKGRSAASIRDELHQLCHVVHENTGEADSRDAVHLVVATIMDRELLATFLEIPASQVVSLNADGTIQKDAPQAVLAQAPAPAPPDAAPPRPADDRPVKSAQQPKTPAVSGRKSKSEGSIRVNVKILDTLMTLAGEMVLTRNQLLQNLASDADMRRIEKTAQRIDAITTELQDAIMSTRMQSVGIVFNKFRRVVHDMSRSLGKEIELELEGEEVELDKTIIEAIGDPLTHLVRNAIDHGIETPEQRLAAGKPRCGTLRLAAFHKAGQVIIEVTDDGRGLDAAKIREKAAAMGMLTPQELHAMPDQAVFRLIFKPGFSTATKVTDISGRGVGMDVVSSNLSAIGGVVDLESELGKGTTIRVKLPLTLAILPSLMVEVGGEHFAIPQMNLLELQRIPANKVASTIEKLGSVNVMRLRGELLPLVDLRTVLRIPARDIATPDGVVADRRQDVADRRQDDLPTDAERRISGERRHMPTSAINIAVVAAGEFRYGIIVDNLLDSEEIVVKPLGRHLSDCRSYAGATILGNGHAALILDVVGISQMMSLQDTTDQELYRREQAQREDRKQTDRQSLLLIENAKDDVLAVPLGLVERVEKVVRTDIQMVAGRRTIRYRDGSLMLFAIEDVVNVPPLDPESDVLYVIVSKIAGREAGIMCSSIVDSIDANITIDEVTHRQTGVFGSAIIADRITLLLDLHAIVTTVMPDWVADAAPQRAATRTGAPTDDIDRGSEAAPQRPSAVLVVEDSKFFMNQIKSVVEAAGLQVFTAQDGLEALEVLERQPIDLVVTDIEMPNLDGFGLVERMRQRPETAHIPAIAVTSVMGEIAESRAREVGIDEYLIKLDRDQILERSLYFLEHGRHGAATA